MCKYPPNKTKVRITIHVTLDRKNCIKVKKKKQRLLAITTNEKANQKSSCFYRISRSI